MKDWGQCGSESLGNPRGVEASGNHAWEWESLIPETWEHWVRGSENQREALGLGSKSSNLDPSPPTFRLRK